ncbi:MAG: hypothetical protein WBS19_20760 [Candidatus Korobacteraceae bacterium]
MKVRLILTFTFLAWLLTPFAVAQSSDPLPSWNDGASKQAILNFVHATTDASSANFVPPEQRFATFDQDGTTWVEYPMYTQFIFAFERVAAMAPLHPAWKTTEPFKSILAGDKKASNSTVRMCSR